MDRVKSNFSIKNLEHLSGIKAHTIRIWEKRYNLFEPERTDTNIRLYNLENLQKLLNVTLLYNNGYKISKIALLSPQEINENVHKLTINKNADDWSIGLFKLAMINFDQRLFTKTFNDLLEQFSFSEVFKNVFVPLMNELGVLWQTNSISPSHEHFITSLVKQKIHAMCEDLQQKSTRRTDRRFVLFLPDNEIHELGLLYLQYEVLNNGFQCVFLGQSVPIESLSNLVDIGEPITFISYFTIEPSQDKIKAYLNTFNSEIIENIDSELWILGYQVQFMSDEMPDKMRKFRSIDDVIYALNVV
ncbi:MAG: MerR family transcriptional regulator [Flavobacteriaceae bacterium]|jgi:DNA-binding transcriptional MerR regulator|nr:MerR family transcriptional regulator [Flavobacteriaceae bacterium]MDG2289777.1 MerR family transcriptional regulator [Flavobacteriaceae bacterium]